MARKRLAVMGAGLIGREHCALIAAHEGAALVAIADPAPAAADLAAKLSAAHFDDYADMLDATRPDGVIVALPNALHRDAGLACVDRGIPCFMEKPVADTVQAARDLAAASSRAGIPVLVGHHRRHSPDIRAARDVVRQGRLGPVVAVSGMWMADKPDPYFDADWRRRAGGGPLLINLIHDIDCLRYIVGEIESVRAFTASGARSFEVEDTASIAIRFECGALGSFILSDAVASPFTWEIASGQALYFPTQPGDCYVIGGRRGTLTVPGMTLWRHEAADGHWQDPFIREAVPLDSTRCYQNQLDHFLAVIDGTAEPVVTADDAMRTLAATLAVDIAAREDRTVTVAEVIAGG